MPLNDERPEGYERRQYQDQRGQGWRPIPDPTQLTTEQLHREVGILKSLLDERMKGMDELVDEKLAGVEKQFTLIERQRVEQKIDGERAIAAALQAAKEAVGEQTAASEKSVNKSEGVATKNIDQLGEKFSASFEGQRRDIDTLNQRITIIEASKLGGAEAMADMGHRLNTSIAAATVIVSLAALGSRFL